jgi:hypothetical protein
MKIEDTTITVEKCKDSGLALVLISLLCFQFWGQSFLVLMAIAFLLVAMTYPPLFKPFAKVWFALSTALGTIVSKIILTVIFYVVVFPVATVRKLMGKDTMQIKNWKQGNTSVFRKKSHSFTAKDLEHPY